MAQMSHPPHIDLSSPSSSAFIPFCAFKASMAISEPRTWLPNISYPICSSFQETILDGQLCYKLDVKTKAGEGKRNQLMLLLDYSENHAIYAFEDQPEEVDPSKIKELSMEDSGQLETKEAKVHIGTLSSFKGSGGGIYKMSAVKKMTTTEDFLGLTSQVRKCEVDSFEQCRNKKVQELCSCVHLKALGAEVIVQFFQIFLRCVDLCNVTFRVDKHAMH